LLVHPFQCPECGSNRVWKAGLRHINFGDIQRCICRDCGYRFSDPDFSRKITNRSYDKQDSRQICALKTKRVKNLVAVEETKQKTAGEKNIKGEIVSFAWHLKKLGRSTATIKTYTKYLKMLHKAGATLSNPESTKLTIATNYKDQNTKRLATYAYDAFLKYLNVPWEKPQYRQEHKRVFIPTDQELQTVINTGRKQSIVFSQSLYETGARVNEAQRVSGQT
jgi:transposase-like protein